MSEQRSTTDELGQQHDVPALGLPREQLLTYAMMARLTSGALRTARERRGRAAWAADEEAARIHLAADAAAIDKLTTDQAREWNGKVADGDITITRVDPSGIVIASAPLSDGIEVVQATLHDRTVTVAAGSTETAQHVRDWLAANPHNDSLHDLRSAATDVADTRRLAADADADAARDVDDTTLRERLTGRIPDTVFGDRRWPVAEKTYRDLVKAGADPTALADAAAGLNFESTKVRTPAGLIAWQMRKAAQGQTHPTDESQARREAAAEWLAGAANTPTDRARASRLVGQIDQQFDAQLADKYPGILTAPDPTGRWHGHTHAASVETDLAANHDENVWITPSFSQQRAGDDEVAVVHGTGNNAAREDGEAAQHITTAASNRAAAASDDSDRAAQAAAAERAAAAPTRPPRTPPPAAPHRGRPKGAQATANKARTNTRVRTR